MKGLAGKLVVGLAGHRPSDSEAAWLEEHQPAGVILFSRNVFDYSQLYDLCRFLHELVPGLEIVADHEGGPISQLAAAVGRPPAPWGLGVLDDAGLTARVHEETGRRLHSVGIDRVLAPVADAMSESRNPVIGSRSFGADPTLVARHTVAAVTGLLKADLGVCLKHWPGHGGSRGDSHLAETSVAEGAVPAPFESGLDAGADAVMVGHLLPGFPAGGPPPRPATLDPEFMAHSRSGLEAGSRAKIRFYADDITMGALGPAMARSGVAVPEVQPSGLYDPETLPLAWFEELAKAGCDRFLIRGIPRRAFPSPARPGTGSAATEVCPSPEPSFSPEPYAEARRRMWALAGGGFADPEADLGWLDLSRGDRWAVAAGQDTGSMDEGPWPALGSRLKAMFAKVREVEDLESGTARWNRLVVSSYRPWPESVGIGSVLPAKGVCLAMGHPSLKSDLENRLPHGWRVGALFDIAPEDLPEPGTKI